LSSDEVIIGAKAQRQRIANPANTYSSIKRLIGLTKKEAKSVGLKVTTYACNPVCIMLPFVYIHECHFHQHEFAAACMVNIAAGHYGC
jgi:Hsp70 protein